MNFDWPNRVTSLENDIRVYKEKLRKVRARDIRFAEERRAQIQQISDLKERNGKLQLQLSEVSARLGAQQAKGGASESEENMLPIVRSTRATKERLEKMAAEVQSLKDANLKLSTHVSVVESARSTDRVRAQRAAEKHKAETRALHEEMQGMRKELEKRDKAVRLQIMQVKQLKYKLRELLTSNKPVSLPLEMPHYSILKGLRSQSQETLHEDGGCNMVCRTLRLRRNCSHLVQKITRKRKPVQRWGGREAQAE